MYTCTRYADKPNHMLEYNIGLNNSFCLEDDQEEVNFTIHCISEQNFMPSSVKWTYDHGIVLDLNQQEINNILHYENGQNSLAFGPASLSEIISTFNVSNESNSLVVRCRRFNSFGEDIASIQITKCGRFKPKYPNNFWLKPLQFFHFCQLQPSVKMELQTTAVSSVLETVIECTSVLVKGGMCWDLMLPLVNVRTN